VAHASAQRVYLVQTAKLVAHLGVKFPLPIRSHGLRTRRGPAPAARARLDGRCAAIADEAFTKRTTAIDHDTPLSPDAVWRRSPRRSTAYPA